MLLVFVSKLWFTIELFLFGDKTIGTIYVMYVLGHVFLALLEGVIIPKFSN
jgi:hypothetical protein